MKIAVCGPLSPDSFADNVVDTLGRLGHEVIALGPARPTPKLRRAANAVQMLSDHVRQIDGARQRPLVKQVQVARPDLLLTIDRRLHPSVISAAQGVGALVALWFPDHTGTMADHSLFLAGYNRIYLKNPVLADELSAIHGLPVKYLPEAANSSWHRSTLGYGSDRTVVVAGNIHPTRALLLDRLLADGFPVQIYGPPVPSWIDRPRVAAAHSGEFVARQRKADVFRSAAAVLNNLHPAESAGMNCRLFEAAASGAAVVTEERQGLRDLFHPGREVSTFDTYDELTKTLRELLDDPERGRSIADAAAARAHAEHTYEHRLEAILTDLTDP